jgi:oligopeptide/dipeptide ABC transporter ATP-binding protein
MDVFHNPKHPYTQGLLRSVPRLGSSVQKKDRLDVIEGMVPNLLHLPEGCSFAPRCYKRTVECTLGPIPLELVVEQSRDERSECKRDAERKRGSAQPQETPQPSREVRCIHA